MAKLGRSKTLFVGADKIYAVKCFQQIELDWMEQYFGVDFMSFFPPYIL